MSWQDAELRQEWQGLSTPVLESHLRWIEAAVERLKDRARVLSAVLAERRQGEKKNDGIAV